MYKIIKDVIDSKDYRLEDMLHKISKMYIEDRITESEKSELDNLARMKAKAKNSYDLQKQLEEIFARLEDLENQEISQEPEEAIEEYPEYIQPIGCHDSYKIGDKVTYKNNKYICVLDNCVWSPETYPQGWEKQTSQVEENKESEV